MRSAFGKGKVRRSIGVGCAVALLAAWTTVSAAAAVVSNTAAIAIPSAGSDGRANPYPSEISVTQTGPITDVNVTLTGVSHAYPDDVDVLLVGPTGLTTALMADAGGEFDLTDLTISFVDAASTPLPGSSQIVAGTYKPTGSGFEGTAPAPAGPYGATLSVFHGADAAGVWKLFVFDDVPILDGGSIAGGWSLDITTLAISSLPPSASVGDQIVITGTGFTGATAVKFGAIPAIAFTVDSDTQITATVPAGATTGPVSVTVPVGTVTSAEDLVVNHARDVSLTMRGKKAIGTVNVKDGLSACASNVPIKVQHLKKGTWRTVAGVLTKADGSYRAVGLDDPGKYRTLAKRTTLSSGDVCLKDLSPVDRK